MVAPELASIHASTSPLYGLIDRPLIPLALFLALLFMPGFLRSTDPKLDFPGSLDFIELLMQGHANEIGGRHPKSFHDPIDSLLRVRLEPEIDRDTWVHRSVWITKCTKVYYETMLYKV
jgi:hypothetical protein